MDYTTLKNANPNIKKSYQSFFSPGRINLIGEHVDNYGGHVLPVAIDLGISGFISIRPDETFTMSSTHFPDLYTGSVKTLEKAEEGHWVNYAIGMIKAFASPIPYGFDLVIHSTLPMGAGLSSSASLELLIGTIINELYHMNKKPLELVKMAKEVENNFIGVKCGIMDQFAIGMGKEDQAMYLNTGTLEMRYIPIVLDGHKLVIANSNKKRALVSSEYNNRKKDADESLKNLQSLYELDALAHLKSTDLEAIKGLLTPNQFKRVRHIVTEEARTNAFIQALSAGRINQLGKILLEGHASLKTDFEVSCFETDTLVELFALQGALGARMIGAGFGGCVLALVPNSFHEKEYQKIQEMYHSLTGLDVDFYDVQSSDGTKKL